MILVLLSCCVCKTSVHESSLHCILYPMFLQFPRTLYATAFIHLQNNLEYFLMNGLAVRYIIQGHFKKKHCSNLTNNTVFHLSCEEHVFTVFILPDILLVSAYIYGIYVFRYKHPEYLSTLMETVSDFLPYHLYHTVIVLMQTFLGYCTKHGRYHPKYLIKSLQ